MTRLARTRKWTPESVPRTNSVRRRIPGPRLGRRMHTNPQAAGHRPLAARGKRQSNSDSPQVPAAVTKKAASAHVPRGHCTRMISSERELRGSEDAQSSGIRGLHAPPWLRQSLPPNFGRQQTVISTHWCVEGLASEVKARSSDRGREKSSRIFSRARWTLWWNQTFHRLRVWRKTLGGSHEENARGADGC